MAYTPPEYPAAIPDEVTDLPDRLDDIDWIEAARYNEVKKELVAIMTELGTDPAGASTDVKTRLALLALIADPTFTGDATIPTIDLTGGQIKFPAGVQASADANTLDDYEEGTFTLTLTCSTSGTITLNAGLNKGSYTKIGNIVTVHGQVTTSAIDTPVGTELKINGLPFAIAAVDEGANIIAASVYVSGMGSALTKNLMALGVNGNSYIRLYEGDGTSFEAICQKIDASTDIAFGMTYRAA